MGNIISKVKETVANIDVQQLKEDVKTNIEYLDMGNVLGGAVRAAEKVDVNAIKAKVNSIKNSPAISNAVGTAKSLGGVAVDMVSDLLKK